MVGVLIRPGDLGFFRLDPPLSGVGDLGDIRIFPEPTRGVFLIFLTGVLSPAVCLGDLPRLLVADWDDDDDGLVLPGGILPILVTPSASLFNVLCDVNFGETVGLSSTID